MKVTERRELVVVRDFMGRALVRIVCDADRVAVYVTDEAGFAKGLTPVGFPIQDVFVYKPGFDVGKVDWNKLAPWTSP